MPNPGNSWIEKDIELYDPSKTDETLQREGWSKDAEGFWNRDGERLTMRKK